MRNLDLMQRTLDYIRCHPDEWNQGAWRCRTGMCFAGHAAMQAGAVWTYSLDELDDPACVVTPETRDAELMVITPDNTMTDVITYAAETLGVSTHDMLFDSENTLEDLQLMVTSRVTDGSCGCVSCRGFLDW